MFPVPFARRTVIKRRCSLIRASRLDRPFQHLVAATSAPRDAVRNLPLAQNRLERLTV